MMLLLVLALGLRAEVDFAREVHPILIGKCGGCHSGPQAQAGLDLNTRAGTVKSVKVGDSRNSTLIQRVDGSKNPRMPLNAPPLSEAEVATLRKWIDEGAKGHDASPAAAKWDPPLLPRKPPVPAGANHPVDAFLRVQGEVVNDAVFARRVYFDLWGLPPSPEELRTFQADRDSRKREKLIDRLLADPAKYTGHWISYWNDLLRNDDGVIYHGDRKSITKWLEKALRENMPYDRMLESLLNPVSKDEEGFIVGMTWRGEVPASERPPLQAAQNSAQAFLGINLKCNSCHDSFISSWKLKDAYGLAALFSDGPLELVRCDVRMGENAKPKFLYPELGEATDGPLAVRRAQAARFFTMPENGRTRRTIVNRYWKLLFGRGLVEPVDDMSAEPFHPDLLDWLAVDFAENGHDLKHLLKRLMMSRAYQLPSVDGTWKSGEAYTFRGPHKRRLSAEQFVDAVAAITGEWRLKVAPNAPLARMVREWELKSTALSRAMGRPIRDQVTTERLTMPTTLQALELVNGRSLAEWLRDGAERLAENPPPAPVNRFDSGIVRRSPVPVDVELGGASKLWLLVENVDSYDPTRVRPLWKDAVVVAGRRRIPLSEFADLSNLKLPSRIEVDLKDLRADRFLASAQVAAESLGSDIGPAVRFFVFDKEPDFRRLIRTEPETPVALPAVSKSPDALLDRLYRHAFQREASAEERAAALEVLGPKLTTPGVEDLLWMLFMSPEFQYIR